MMLLPHLTVSFAHAVVVHCVACQTHTVTWHANCNCISCSNSRVAALQPLEGRALLLKATAVISTASSVSMCHMRSGLNTIADSAPMTALSYQHAADALPVCCFPLMWDDTGLPNTLRHSHWQFNGSPYLPANQDVLACAMYKLH